MTLFIFAALSAYFIKGLCGFANTLLFNCITSFGADNVNISPVDLILGFPSNVILTWNNRKSLDRKVWLPLAGLVLAGNIPGIFLLKNADATSVKILFGAAVIFIGTEMLYREYRPKTPNANTIQKPVRSQPFLMIIGLMSGILCGLYGVGALLAAYISRVTDSQQAFKANMCAVFVTENVFRLIVYSATGILTTQVLRQAILLYPVMLVGLWLGMKSACWLNESLIKRLVILLLILSGISLIVTNLI